MIWFGTFVAIAGAFWRRWWGGWPAGVGVLADRWPKLLVALALGYGACWPLPWWCALMSSALLAAYWVPAHDLTNWTWKQWLLRYGPFGVFYILAQKLPFAGPNAVIDGSFALAEFAIGGSVYAIAVWAASWV